VDERGGAVATRSTDQAPRPAQVIGERDAYKSGRTSIMGQRTLRALGAIGVLAQLVTASCMLGACSAVASSAPPGSADGAAADGPAWDLGSGFDATPALENWLLSVGNGSAGAAGSTHALAQISIVPGELGSIHQIICPDLVFGGADVAQDVVSGLTFHEGVLYAVGATGGGAASRPAASLYRIDPCACTATRLGDFGPELGLVGSVASYGNQGLFGVASTNNAFFRIDPATGAGTLVKTLPFAYGASGLSWSGPVRDTLWGIESNTDSLYELNAQGDYVREPLVLDYDFQGLGMEFHPGAQTLFACSQNRILVVNTTTGHIEVGPEFTWDSGCANLAAPYGSVSCIGNIN